MVIFIEQQYRLMTGFRIVNRSTEGDRKMWSSFFPTVAAVVLLSMGHPSAAMMGSDHGHVRGYDSQDESRNDRRSPRQDREAPLLHWHGDYSHSHEDGEIPHSQDSVGTTRETSRERISPARGGDPSRQEVTPGSRQKPAGPLNPAIQAKDEVVMHLVQAGTLTLPANAGESGFEPAGIDGFYMDETQVTNHQYVEFLNRVVSRTNVEKGVVRGDKKIWLYLGEVRKGYEPIVFEEGRFRVKGVYLAACAVLRVTPEGASAYARFYGKRIPTESEWRYAVKVGAGRPVEAADVPAAYPPIPSPVILYPANSIGIRGLNANLGEWGTRWPPGSSSKDGDTQPEYLVLGGASSGSAPEGTHSPAIRRYPWEAFAEVSFRCVMDAPSATGESVLPSAREEPTSFRFWTASVRCTTWASSIATSNRKTSSWPARFPRSPTSAWPAHAPSSPSPGRPT